MFHVTGSGFGASCSVFRDSVFSQVRGFEVRGFAGGFGYGVRGCGFEVSSMGFGIFAVRGLAVQCFRGVGLRVRGFPFGVRGFRGAGFVVGGFSVEVSGYVVSRSWFRVWRFSVGVLGYGVYRSGFCGRGFGLAVSLFGVSVLG